MNNTETVSPTQMALLMFSFMAGSSIIYVPSILIMLADHDAWLAVFPSLTVGIFLLLIVLYLHRRYDGLTFVGYARKNFGVFSAVSVLLFAIYLSIMVAWITQGVSGFMTSTMMRQTPDYVFHSLILATAAMTVRSGFEVMTRMFVLLSWIMIILIGAVLILAIPTYHPSFVLPLLSEGWKPLMLASYFSYGFPFAEVVIFSMLFTFTSKGTYRDLRKYVVIAVLWSSVLLIVTTISTMMVFGPAAPDMKFSLFAISRYINLEDFLQRIESVIGISLIAGSYMKATIALFALNLMLSQWLRMKDSRILVFPITLFCFMLTMTMFESEADFYEKFTFVLPLINLICAVLPILLIALLTLLKSEKT